MIEYHVKVKSDLDSKITRYREAHGFNKSDGARHLIELGLYNLEMNQKLELNSELLSKIYSKELYIIDLLEKLYSDLEITNDSNPKENKILQEFKINRYKDKFND